MVKSTLKIICATLLFFAATSVVAAQFSFRRPVGFVNDFEGIIDSEVRIELERKLADLRERKGIEVVVVTTDNFSDDTIEGFSNDLYDHWRISSNGLLFIVSQEKRETRIEVGYDMEQIFTDARVGRLLDNYVIPELKNDNYTSGIEAGVDNILRIIDGDVQEFDSIGPSDDNMSRAFDYFSVGLLVFFFLAEFMASTKSWWLGGVVGVIAGIALGMVFSSLSWGLAFGLILGVLGLIIDFVLSKLGKRAKAKGRSGLFLTGRSGSRSSGGSSFGGFSGGGRGSGGGGASRGF